MRFVRDFRLVPLVLLAIGCFSLVKIASLVLEGGYIFRDDGRSGRLSWAQEVLNYPASRPTKFERAAGEITGSVQAPKKEEAAKKDEPAKAAPASENLAASQDLATSPAERAVLERLQARRQELEARARELEIRESLLKAHEKRIQGRVDELKAVEGRISVATQQKDEADAARFKGIVAMYEAMKPKDAAKIFDRLDMATLFDIASHMKPQKMSDVLAQMQPEAAERLTVELARRSGGERPGAVSDLPKIEGRPALTPTN